MIENGYRVHILICTVMGIATCMHKNTFSCEKMSKITENKTKKKQKCWKHFPKSDVSLRIAAIIVSPRHSVVETMLPCFKRTYVDKVKTIQLNNEVATTYDLMPQLLMDTCFCSKLQYELYLRAFSVLNKFPKVSA